ncbi:FadR/GntR family transcriptional regulator [Paraburkholderia sp. D1E]|uniref:FadR/GntR family transcriptional regulator n=1 Tax=Paraburkholderia sp. D1E TaxID=3461398 RepID=UPI004045A332
MEERSAPEWQPSKRLKRGNAADQIFEDLRESVLGGQLPRGTKLPTEKQLADSYGVSGATIREAIRGLTSARLVEVRHGSGAYVTAETDHLVALSLRSMIQIERIGVPQVLGVLSALTTYAAELAAVQATDADIDAMQEALRQIQQGSDVAIISSGVMHFIESIANASGNPLLAALCRFLTTIQIGLATELSGGTVESWRATTGSLSRERQRLFKAIKDRNPEAAGKAARAYHDRAQKIITAQPNAHNATVSDPVLAQLLSSSLQNKGGMKCRD